MAAYRDLCMYDKQDNVTISNSEGAAKEFRIFLSNNVCHMIEKMDNVMPSLHLSGLFASKLLHTWSKKLS